jgi:hypothetical protein
MIIEYITNQLASVEERFPFVVDVNAVDVQLTTNFPAIIPKLRNGNGDAYFQQKDAVRLLSIGLFLPYQFGLSTKSAYIECKWQDTITFNGIKELTGSFSATGYVIPYDNTEFGVDVLVEYPSAESKYCWVIYPVDLGSTRVRISMINAPASLDGTTQYASIFAKVAHTLPMVA